MEVVQTVVVIVVFTAIFIVLPAALLLRLLDSLRDPDPTPRPAVVRWMLRLPTFVLGLVAILFGGSLILWVLYNLFVERQPEYSGPSGILGGFGTGPICIYFGVECLRATFRKAGTLPPDDHADDSWDDGRDGEHDP